MATLDFSYHPNVPVLHTDLAGRTVVVVGSNVGIGFEAAKHFARMNPKRLIVTCRSQEKGVQTVESQFLLSSRSMRTRYSCTCSHAAIQKETGFVAVEFWPLELTEFASVKAFADRFETDGGDLDILVANAAIVTRNFVLTSDGHEKA